jgi:ABC-type nitrate/sulfonate/bicarbonate transport system substrate-binding protein
LTSFPGKEPVLQLRKLLHCSMQRRDPTSIWPNKTKNKNKIEQRRDEILRAFGVLLSAIFFCAAIASPVYGQSEPPRTLNVVAFDGGWNLPIWAAQRQGFFAQNKLTVNLRFTPNSVELVTGLIAGKSDLAFAGIDNVIAYQEGQGEVAVENPDLFAFMGGDNGLLSVVAAAPIKSFADLKGKTLSVDAMTTGFAFVLREAVVRNGLSETDVKFVRAGGTANRYNQLISGKSDATLLRTPFDLLARERGFTVLAAGKALGNYQGTVGVASRRWAANNEETLVRFIRSYRAGLEWLYLPENHPVAEAILVANIPDMSPQLAKIALRQLLENGFQKDGAIDVPGIRNVLALRNKYGQPHRDLSDPARYFDLHFYESASRKVF